MFLQIAVCLRFHCDGGQHEPIGRDKRNRRAKDGRNPHQHRFLLFFPVFLRTVRTMDRLRRNRVFAYFCRNTRFARIRSHQALYLVSQTCPIMYIILYVRSKTIPQVFIASKNCQNHNCPQSVPCPHRDSSFRASIFPIPADFHYLSIRTVIPALNRTSRYSSNTAIRSTNRTTMSLSNFVTLPLQSTRPSPG